MERKASTPPAASVPSAASGANGQQQVAKWRVGERISPPTRHELAFKALQSTEAHPLSSANAYGAVQSRVQALSNRDGETREWRDVMAKVLVGQTKEEAMTKPVDDSEQLDPLKQELVVLQDGDIDPLGVLSAGLPGSSDPLSSAGLVKASSGTLSSTTTPSHLDRKRSSRTIPDSPAASLSQKQAPPPTTKQLWKTHKDRVLQKFENVTFKIKASMLEAHDLENEISWTSRAQYDPRDDRDPIATDGIHVLKKTRERLELLERRPSSSGSSAQKEDRTVEMSQSEYVEKIHIMENELVAAWNQNQKVAALRIAIKSVKLLGDTTSSPQLYPCVFVLVSDLLDTFGNLVFERIKARGSEDENGQPLPTPLSENFVSSDVNIHAKETCRNWFYKTACIRELLPRIGVGEPMVALYTRVYLALSGSELLQPSDKTAVLSSLFDYFFSYNQFQATKLEKWLETNNLTQEEYLGLHSPAVEWLMKCAASDCHHEAFGTILAHYREYSDNSMVLKHICEAFGAQFYASRPLVMLHLMRLSTPSQYTKCHLYSLLALQLSASPTLTTTKEGKLQFLNDAWTSITSQEDIAQYMECAAAYMKLIVAHFSHREALILLKDVVRHLNAATPDELTPKVYNLMGALIENVVYGAQEHFEFFTKLIPSSEFLSLMGMFKRESSVGVAKKVLRAFVSLDRKSAKYASGSSMRLHVVGPEAAVAHTLFVICCRVHDALDSLSTATERADATRDICAFISRLGYAFPQGAHDASRYDEKQQEEEEEALLMLFIDCRSAFYKLEHVKTTLAKNVLTLAMQVHKRTARHSSVAAAAVGMHNDKKVKNRRNFIKSCLAYAHITIPSISDPFRKLELMTLSAKVALVNNCLPQMDALLKAAIVQITELDPSKFYYQYHVPTSSTMDGGAIDDLEFLEDADSHANESDGLVRTIGDLVSILVYAPSLTDDDAFYFVNGLRKAVLERMAWEKMTSSPIPRVQVSATRSRVRILLFLMQLYGLWGQKQLPQRITGLDSNDVLYGGDDSFSEQVHLHFTTTIEDIVREIEAMDHIRVPGDDEKSETSALPVAASTQTIPVEVQLCQIELMLDFVSQVTPMLAQDECSPSTNFDSSLDIFAAGETNKSRRRKRSRCGAVLVRKCITFLHEKVKILSTATKSTISADRDVRKQVQWIQTYYETTHEYLAAYFATVRKQQSRLVNANTTQAIQVLEDCLATSSTSDLTLKQLSSTSYKSGELR
ncbi:hypothetical protein FI667_g2958, partial [Globisporangium splendens]